MMGKDTLNIAGTIAARNGAIYMEFTDDRSVDSFEKKGRTTTNYNIRFPIKESFSIRNSQIDATISGELAMTRQFENDWNYSGEIEFTEGEIYYYLGDVFKNLQGTMIMDGQGFNPFLDFDVSKSFIFAIFKFKKRNRQRNIRRSKRLSCIFCSD